MLVEAYAISISIFSFLLQLLLLNLCVDFRWESLIRKFSINILLPKNITKTTTVKKWFHSAMQNIFVRILMSMFFFLSNFYHEKKKKTIVVLHTKHFAAGWNFRIITKYWPWMKWQQTKVSSFKNNHMSIFIRPDMFTKNTFDQVFFFYVSWPSPHIKIAML